jgi:hypothetical protein
VPGRGEAIFRAKRRSFACEAAIICSGFGPGGGSWSEKGSLLASDQGSCGHFGGFLVAFPRERSLSFQGNFLAAGASHL